jgi:glycosyltransferase involved in cell wall biosynthesis
MARYDRAFKVRHAAVCGTYLPRKCGIATFTKDLRDALAGVIDEEGLTAVALDDDGAHYCYPRDVHFQIRVPVAADYRTAADMLNINQVDVTFLQHEYGIFGGRDGVLVLELIRRLRMPVVVTLHTVLKEPTRTQARVMREIAEAADRLVVMSERGREFLTTIYGIPEEKVAFIPHGIPDVPFVDASFYKDQFGLAGRTTILTFGLLAKGKGIEVMLKAMPAIVARHPEVTYVVLGATHPHVLRDEGDAYRSELERLVVDLGLRDHVVFLNRFVSLDELCGYIGAADVYVTPYAHEAQITSGTLAYACGAGKAVVSTPYWYAQELLDEGRGLLFPFGDSDALAEQVLTLLDDQHERDAMRKRIYMHCRKMVWHEVARGYLEVAAAARRDWSENPRQRELAVPSVQNSELVPAIDLRHLQAMTDDTGIYQHAIYTIPDRDHGYCTDDNARALVAALRYYDQTRDDSALPLVSVYLAFLHSAFNTETQRFRNFMSFDRQWLEESGSEDSHARAIWALGEAVALAPNDGIRGYTTRLFNAALPAIAGFDAIRPSAFGLVGIHAYLRRFGGDTEVRRVRAELAHNLMGAFQACASDDWPWCEEMVTYDNGKLPHALLLAGKWLPDSGMVEMGLKALRWLFTIQTSEHGYMNPVGCNGWYPRGQSMALFDQQPLEMMSLVDAAAEAYRQTNDAYWVECATRCLEWFLGKNAVGVALYDFKTGGCRDGLTPQGANLNEGAESTLSWLLTAMTVQQLMTPEKDLEEESLQDVGD